MKRSWLRGIVSLGKLTNDSCREPVTQPMMFHPPQVLQQERQASSRGCLATSDPVGGGVSIRESALSTNFHTKPGFRQGEVFPGLLRSSAERPPVCTVQQRSPAC